MSSAGRRVVMEGDEGGSSSGSGGGSAPSRPLTLNERFSTLPKPPRQDVKTNFAVNLNAVTKQARQIQKQDAQKKQRQNVVTKRRIAAAPSVPAAQNLRESLARPSTRSTRGGVSARGARGGRGGRATASITSVRGGPVRGRGRGRGGVAASVPVARGRGRSRGGIAKGGRASAPAPAPASNGARGRGAPRGRGAVAGRGRGGARGRGRGGRGGFGGGGALDKDALDAEMDSYMGKDHNIEKLNEELDAYAQQRPAKPANGQPAAAAAE